MEQTTDDFNRICNSIYTKNFDIVLPITVVRWPANGDRKKERKRKEIFLDRLHVRTNKTLVHKTETETERK